MSNEMTSGSASFSEMKDKLFSEFDKMSLILQEEKNKFEEQMTRRRKDFDLELQNRLAELATEKEELKDAKDQFQKEKDKFTKELEKKTIRVCIRYWMANGPETTLTESQAMGYL